MEQKSLPQQYLSAIFEFSKDGTDYQPYYLIYNLTNSIHLFQLQAGETREIRKRRLKL
jgi:hypothetical protein